MKISLELKLIMIRIELSEDQERPKTLAATSHAYSYFEVRGRCPSQLGGHVKSKDPM